MKKHNTKNTNYSFLKIDPDPLSMDIQNSIYSCEFINKYIELNNQAMLLMKEGKFNEALKYFENASSIAEKLNDYYKINESKCNIGIIYFQLNYIKEAVNLFQNSFNYFYNCCSNKNHKNDIKYLTMLCKSGANLCMCKILFFNGNDEDEDNPKYLINDIINIIIQEEDLNLQIFCVKYLNDILFNVNILMPINNNILESYINENNIDTNQLNSDEEIKEEIDKIDKLYKESFFNFIATNEYEPWINALDIIYQKMEELNYTSEMNIILFNKQIAICLKYLESIGDYNKLNNNPEWIDSKKKLLELFQVNFNYKIKKKYSNNEENNTNIDEELINNIINDYQNKLFIIREIYNILLNFKSQINKNYSLNEKEDNNIINMNYYNNNIKINNNYEEEDFNFNFNSEYFLKISLIYAKKYFENNIEDYDLKNQFINNINIALDALDKPQISGLDLSNINLSSIDPELYEHFCNIFRNMFKSYHLRSKFRNLVEKALNYINNNSNKKLKSGKKNKVIKKNFIDNKLEDFFERAYQHIYNGQYICKINFRNNQIKEHYFQIENKNDSLQYFEGEKETAKKEFYLDDLLKVKIGFETNNVINKVNKLSLCNKYKNEPYKFISFIFDNAQNSRTLDLMLTEENDAKNWFYGLNYYFHISKRPYKICSCTNYIRFRIKNKIINKLKLDIEDIKNETFVYYILKYFNRYEEEKVNESDDE